MRARTHIHTFTDHFKHKHTHIYTLTQTLECAQDVRYFFILLGILYGGFAIAFNMQLGGDSDESQTTALYLFTTMVGDFSSSFVLTVLQDEGQW